MLVRGLSFAAVVTLLVIGPSLVSAQEQLAWKFSAGESLNYVVRQKMNMTLDVAGKQQTIVMNQMMDMQWRITDVDSGTGDANMAQTIGRVQMESQGGQLGSLKFDSASEEIQSTPFGKAIAAVYKKLIGQEFGVHMQSTGKIDDVKVPESLLASLKQSGSTGNALDENTLKQLMTQSAITLPSTPIKPGHSWDSMQQVEMPFGSMVVKSKLTFQGVDPGTGYAQIGMIPSISLTPKPGTDVDVKLTKTEGKGTMLFDVVRGRIAKSDLNLTMAMQTNSFGQIINKTIEQTTSMTLEN